MADSDLLRLRDTQYGDSSGGGVGGDEDEEEEEDANGCDINSTKVYVRRRPINDE